LLDRLVPSDVHDVDQRLRARVLVAVALVFLALTGARTMLFWSLGMLPAAGALGLMSLLTAANLVGFSRGVSLPVAACVQLGLGTLAVTGLAVLRGGPGTGITTALGTIPVLATLLLGRKGGAAWLGVVVAILLGLSAVEVGVGPIDDWVAPADRLKVDTLVALAVAVSSFVLAGIYEWSKTSASRALVASERERQRAESTVHTLQTERMATIGLLAAGVGHEINNPLTYILCNLTALDDLIDAVPSAEDATLARAALSDIQDGAARIAAIVADLRSYARDDTDADPGPVDVAVAATRALGLVDHQLRVHGRTQTALASGVWVDGHEGRVVQLMVNLLLNAAQATREHPQAYVQVAVALSDGRAVIEVSDNGPGMTEADQARIFEPFFTTRGDQGGTGLGLSICLTIAEQMGGQLTCQSVPGRTTFRFEAPAIAPGRTDALAAEAVDRPLRVLIVDDEPLVARSIAAQLRSHDAVVVTGGRAAIATLGEDAGFDLLLVDVIMGDCGAAEAHRWIRTERPELAERFIAITGGAFTDPARACLRDSGVTVLSKPVSRDALRQIVGRAGARRTA